MKAKVFLVVYVIFVFTTAGAHVHSDPTVGSTPHARITMVSNTGEHLWIGSEWGLTRLNNSTGEMTLFNERLGNGLPNDEITALSVDNQENVWIGTAESGIAKFDGDGWQVFTAETSPLPLDEIMSLATDSEGNVWVGTDNAGLAKFDGADWTIYDQSNSDIPANTVFDIAFDSAGKMYVGTNWGFGSFDGSEWTNYTSYDSDLPNNSVSSLCCDSSGMWIGTRSGLARFEGDTWTIYKKEDTGLGSSSVSELLTDADRNVWIANTDGIARFDGTSWSAFTSENSALPESEIMALTKDSDGNIVAGTHSSLMGYDGTDWKVKESAALTGPDTWSRAADLPVQRKFHVASAFNGKIYVFGGNDGQNSVLAVGEYDPLNDTWVNKSDVPFTSSKWPQGCAEVDGKIYVFTSDMGDKSASSYVYYPDTDLWIQMADMPIFRGQSVFTTVNGKIYAFGGHKFEGPQGFNEVQIYNPITDTWTEGTPMPTPRWGGSACALNGKIYVIGGYNGGESNSGSEQALATVEEYDPVTDTWLSMGDMPKPRYQAGAGVFDGTIYYLAGFAYQRENWFPTYCEKYDPSTDSWTDIASIPRPRINITSCLCDGKLYIIGGTEKVDQWVHSSDVYVYDPGPLKGVYVEDSAPSAFSLIRSYPNPFNPLTTITYRINNPGRANLAVYDLLGRKVNTLVDGAMTPGEYSVIWNAQGFASGVYFCRLEHGSGKVMTHKMLLVK